MSPASIESIVEDAAMDEMWLSDLSFEEIWVAKAGAETA
jgi:hypothetical protein